MSLEPTTITVTELVTRQKVPPGRPTPAPLGPLVWINEMQPVLTQHGPLKNLILLGAFVVVYGDSNSGKTFLVIDLVLHIAAGRPWRGHRATRCLVIYVSAEGGERFANRIAAYRREAPWASGALFATLPQTVNLLDPAADTSRLIDLIRATEDETGYKCGVIVIDTLARAMPGGDESASADMGAFIANVDRLRSETGAAIIAIHHCGKDRTKGARGHSSLRAACDTEILVEGQEGPRVASVTKQRDLQGGQTYAFELVPVEIGVDDEGEPVTSCVVALTDAPIVAQKAAGPSGKQQLAILRLAEAQAKAGRPVLTQAELVKLAGGSLGIARNSARYAVLGLVKTGFLRPSVGGLALAEGPEA